jgi:hypothetical protein
MFHDGDQSRYRSTVPREDDLLAVFSTPDEIGE